MHYEGEQASLVIVLPDEVEGLGDVMQQLAAGHDLMNEIAGLKSTKIDCTMIPKFKIEADLNLMELLPKMGIKSIFDPIKSDIRMFTSDECLYVSKAVQRAVIEVDEKGTTAAAATYMNRQLMSWPPEKQEFLANHPFLYSLYLLAAPFREIPLFLGIYQGKEFAVP